MRDLATQLVGNIVQNGAGRAHTRAMPVASKPGKRMHAEVPLQQVFRRVVFKRPAFVRSQQTRTRALQQRAKGRILLVLLRHDAFRGRIAREVIRHQRRIAALFDPERAGGNVEHGQTKHVACEKQSREVVVTARVEHMIFEHGTRRNHPRDFAPDNPARHGRIFDLVADGHLATGADELGEVGLRRMERNAAHRHALPLGERDVENLGRFLRVLEEHFVEIAEPEKENGVGGNLALDAPILPHHRCRLVGHASQNLRDCASDKG